MDKNLLKKKIEEQKIIVILRGIPADKLLGTVEAIHNGGINFFEITFDQTGKISDQETCSGIKSIKDKFKSSINVGAGTVVSVEQVKMAYDAGCEYIISPDSCTEVIKKTVELGMISIPGAFTPTEIQSAHKAGADYVKLFPICDMGVKYIKNIMAPLSNISLMAVGGVDLDNIKDYLNIGVCGFGIGSNIAKKSLIESNDFEGLTELAKKYVQQVRE